jgi:hypothetical protein
MITLGKLREMTPRADSDHETPDIQLSAPAHGADGGNGGGSGDPVDNFVRTFSQPTTPPADAHAPTLDEILRAQQMGVGQ